MALRGAARREYDLQRRAVIRQDPVKLAIVRAQNQKRQDKKRTPRRLAKSARRWSLHVSDVFLLLGDGLARGLYRQWPTLNYRVVHAAEREANLRCPRSRQVGCCDDPKCQPDAKPGYAGIRRVPKRKSFDSSEPSDGLTRSPKGPAVKCWPFFPVCERCSDNRWHRADKPSQPTDDQLHWWRYRYSGVFLTQTAQSS